MYRQDSLSTFDCRLFNFFAGARFHRLRFMSSPIPAKVLIVSAKAAAWGEKLSKKLSLRGIDVDCWDEERLGTARAASRPFDQALAAASVLVLFSSRAL